jgi:predicted house-cleaning NTP pyrophosphatase (Maf/HAM1 superfamily)
MDPVQQEAAVIPKHPQLILLASGSPARFELLDQIHAAARVCQAFINLLLAHGNHMPTSRIIL